MPTNPDQWEIAMKRPGQVSPGTMLVRAAKSGDLEYISREVDARLRAGLKIGPTTKARMLAAARKGGQAASEAMLLLMWPELRSLPSDSP